MRLITFVTPTGGAAAGVVVGDGVAELGRATGGRFTSVRALLEAGALEEARHAEPDRPLAGLELLAPVPDPSRILCAGVNYDAHRVETGRDPNAHPTIFTRYPSSLVGCGAPLVKPFDSEQFDYEGELAVVIGRRCRRASVEDALTYAAGYSCFMDGSVRDWQRLSSQFTPGKNFDASGSMGPWLVTADEVGDPQALRLQTRLDGEVVQDTPTDLMIHSVAELISFCSQFTTLAPGDVIATGTPGGVGSRRDPPLWMKPGGKVEVEISRVGLLTNGIVEEVRP
ncbi:MAG: fumarylacetoacetate hydrolase family protein [Acidimicrobiales bacterium]